MNQDVFIEEKKKNWENLDTLLRQIKQSGIKSFSTNEIRLLGSLYRKICSDLSYARSKNYNTELVRYLNQLTRKAYGLIYLTDDSERKWTIVQFFTHDFPISVRKHFRFILLAILLFLVGITAGYLWNSLDSRFASSVVPEQMLKPWNDKAEARDVLNDDEIGGEFFPYMSSQYWTHNFRVGLNSFVLGIILGLGPLYFMFYNGLIFGALTSNMVQVNYHIPFFSFVLSHSFVELMAIFICGGAGFMIAWGLIHPGDLYRGDSINKWGREAVKLVLGTIPMFLIAGILESSVSRMNLPIIVKIGFALLSIILMILYFGYMPVEKSKMSYKFKS